MSGRTYIHVEKAELPMESGESVNAFTEKLRKAAALHIAKLRGMQKAVDVWPMEVYANKLVVDVFFREEKDDGKNALKTTAMNPRFFQLAFKRDGDNFQFGETVEVERKVVFTPKAKIEKAMGAGFWDGVI